jgi:hypothetical protein
MQYWQDDPKETSLSTLPPPMIPDEKKEEVNNGNQEAVAAIISSSSEQKQEQEEQKDQANETETDKVTRENVYKYKKNFYHIEATRKTRTS